jgi:hypothetical protein
MPGRVHQFYAVAFEENFSLRQIAPAFPEAKVSPLELFVPIGADGGLYFFPFWARSSHMTFHPTIANASSGASPRSCRN